MAKLDRHQRKALLNNFFQAGIAAVAGRESVIKAFTVNSNFKPDAIIAVGKAANSMCLGAFNVFGDNIPAWVATKYGHIEPALSALKNVRSYEAGHPVPDQQSLVAGKMLLKAVSDAEYSSSLLLLISGGASAIAESLPEGESLAQWQALNQQWLASGLTIAEINQRRKAHSRIKDGQLLSHFKGKKAIVCAISDVQGNDIATIGSGIGAIHRCEKDAEVRVVATNEIARRAIVEQATKSGFELRQNTETLYDDVFKLSGEIGGFLRTAAKGLYLWGGEPTIKLPNNPGNGGRNQSLALALAQEIASLENVSVLVAGTDGTDGPTDAAGAIVDGTTFRYADAAQNALDQANAGDYLTDVEDILITGPTGTNVMDVVIAVVV